MTVDSIRKSGASAFPEPSSGSSFGVAGLAAALILIASLRLFSYLLFHTFAELFSVVIAATYAVIAWNSRENSRESPIVTLGITYFFVAVLDTVHTLAYDGMGIFVGYAYPANQVWVVARVLEACALCFFSFIDIKKPYRLFVVLLFDFIVSAGGLSLIFVFRVFPTCFVAGYGQTQFKVGAELFIISLLAAAWFVFRPQRGAYSRPVYRALLLSIATTAFSELSFMVYANNFDFFNMFGHLLKIVSFYFVYRAVVVTCLEKPQEILFDALRHTMDALRESNEAKDNFISILSHDLRGPLSGIKSVSEVSLESMEGGGALDREYMVEIREAADSSLRLVGRVLDWARARSGDLSPNPEKIDAASIVAAELEALAQFAASKSIALRRALSSELSIRTDGDMLGTIVRNLLQNAIKFTRSGGSVTVSGGIEGDSLVIEISDTGVGIAPEILARLFEPNARVKMQGTNGERGSGFGLVLCSEFASKLGGSLSAKSEEGKGSVFRLELPVRV